MKKIKEKLSVISNIIEKIKKKINKIKEKHKDKINKIEKILNKYSLIWHALYL